MVEFPLEYTLVVFPGNKVTGEIVPELLDLAQQAAPPPAAASGASSPNESFAGH